MLKYSSIFLFFIYSFSQSFSLEKNDSIFTKFSIDQIVSYKKTLENRTSRNIAKRDKLNSEGLNINKSILESKASIGANQDIMLLRLAEFYIDEADGAYFAKSDDFDAKFDAYVLALEKFEEDSNSNPRPIPPKEVVRDYSKPLKMYDRILKEFPKSDFRDEALYNKAFLLQDSEQEDESRVVFQQLIDTYPESPFTPYAIMSLADYYFEPTELKDEDQVIADLKQSISLFKDVLKYKDFDRYDEALYRLGWAYYKLSARDPLHYNDAVLYFTLALDDIASGEDLKIGDKYTNVNIREEAVRYIGISFSQEDNPKGGVAQLTKYVKKLVDLKKPYAAPIMKSLGDIYYEIREDESTIAAYTAFQELFPYDVESALIQKRIVEAYRVYDQKIDYRSDSRSFDERYQMFKKFHSKSEWYKQLLASDIPKKFEILNDAEKNSERALLINIQLLYKDILDKEQEKKVIQSDYETLAQMCQEYLDFFPNFDDAFQVHRSYAEILDTKLSRFEKAYEEYIEASNIYPNAPYKKIKNVAYNAVVVADTLRGIAGDKNISFKFSSSDSVKVEQLTNSEKRQIEAYENYIKIAPEDSNSAKFLFNISAMYFNRKQFANANRYSKTLLLRFPGAQGEALARQQILNGYYARGQYLSAEAVAKKVINDPSSDPSHVEEAKERFFDSVLKNAQSYQLLNKHYIAGLEFRRAALEAPFEKRKNRRFIALYNSGKEFEKMSDLEEANTSYFYILKEKEKLNTYTRRSLVNVAFNYKTLKHDKTAGEYFERLYLDYPDSTDSKQYLANAGASYQQAESWLDAIRINNRYASTFPSDEISKDYLFNNAEFYLKLDDFESANQIYNEFTAKYPDDPRTIEAHYKRGKYYLDKGSISQARPEFVNAIERNERFKAAKKKTDNFHASEAAFELVQLQEAEYDAIVFKWPKSNISSKRKEKTDKLNEIKSNYEKLISYGSPRSFEAPYKIAALYEKFADTYSNQELNPNERDQAKLIKAEGDIRATAAKLYENAIEKYKSAVGDIEKIASKLKIDLNAKKSTKKADTTKVDLTSSNTARALNKDSLRSIANNFIDLSKEKVTSVVFLIAKQSEESISNSLNYKSKYAGKAGQESFDLLVKDEILKKAVRTSVDASIEAHRRNLKTAAELNINNKYVEESKRRIIINSNIIADEYTKLTSLSLDLFNSYYNEYVSLIPKPFGRKGKQYKKDYTELYDNLSTFLEYATDFNEKSLEGYGSTIESARKDSIKNDLFEYTEKSILNGPLAFVTRVNTIRDSLTNKKAQFEKKFESLSDENDSKYNYEDAKGHLEDVLFTLVDNELAALDAAFNTSKDLNLPATPTYVRILKMLINLDPATYAGEVPKNELVVSSDGTWKASKSLSDSINMLSFDDSSWNSAIVIQDSTSIIAFDTLKTKVQAIWYGDNVLSKTEIDSSTITNLPKSFTDSLTNELVYYTENDSLGNPIALEIDTLTGYPLNFAPEYASQTIQFSADTLDTVQVYFRKRINIAGKIYSAKYIGTGDGSVDLFMNGELITSFENTAYDSVDVGDNTLFGEYLKVGDNQLALWITDISKPRQGLKFYIRFEVLPKEFSEKNEEVINETTLLSSAKEKTIQSLIKNRIQTSSLERYKEKEIDKKVEANLPDNSEEANDKEASDSQEKAIKTEGDNNEN